MKSIFIFTITGEQGSHLARHMLKEGWTVGGLTRKLEGKTAIELSNLGAKIFQGDLADQSTYEDHLKGYYSAFVNVDFWSIFAAKGYDEDVASKEETRQAKQAIEACQKMGVSHVVYSALDDVPSVHWKSKSKVCDWIKATSIPATCLYTTFFNSNLFNFKDLKHDGEGGMVVNLTTPDDARIAVMPTEFIGVWVKAALDDPQQ
ncbi:hypothetical protein M231_00624 [Tremella mesenterica]|uniref:NmrA-like domain-containing protein n=1 Tax=Tremella mesenterica TaxID=5217 RepID=A0A4Q1BUT5_TREME|nr:hypothetical protein M231_00624 [Tremella mesenterica]